MTNRDPVPVTGHSSDRPVQACCPTGKILAFCPFGRAQDQEPTIDSTIALVRASMQADRTALITRGMNFNHKEGAAFWPVYREYQYDRSKLDDSRSAEELARSAKCWRTSQ